MQIVTRAVLAVGLFACVIVSGVQTMSAKTQGPACSVINGACVTVSCTGECGPVFPSKCSCIH